MTIIEQERQAIEVEQAANEVLKADPHTTYESLVASVAKATDLYLDEVRVALAMNGVEPAHGRGVTVRDGS